MVSRLDSGLSLRIMSVGDTLHCCIASPRSTNGCQQSFGIMTKTNPHGDGDGKHGIH